MGAVICYSMIQEAKWNIIAWAAISTAATIIMTWRRDAYADGNVAGWLEILAGVTEIACDVANIALVNKVQAMVVRSCIEYLDQTPAINHIEPNIEKLQSAGNGLANHIAKLIYSILPIPFVVLRLAITGELYILAVIAAFVPIAVITAKVGARFTAKISRDIQVARDYRIGLANRLAAETFSSIARGSPSPTAEFVRSGQRLARLTSADSLVSSSSITAAVTLFRLATLGMGPSFLTMTDAVRVFIGIISIIGMNHQQPFETMRRVRAELLKIENSEFIDGLTAQYGHHKDKEGLVLIRGRNGVGKTMLMNIFVGATGPALIVGPKVWMPQRPENVFMQRWGECVACGKNVDHDQAAKALMKVGLTVEDLTKQIGGLSGGQIRRLMLARAIYAAEMNQDAIIFLDEPDSEVDEEAPICQIINGWKHRTVFVIMHAREKIDQVDWHHIIDMG